MEDDVLDLGVSGFHLLEIALAPCAFSKEKKADALPACAPSIAMVIWEAP